MPTRQGYEVHIITDACSSQRPGDRSVAMQRLVQAGALLSTQEMALFQLAGHSKVRIPRCQQNTCRYVIQEATLRTRATVPAFCQQIEM